MEAPMRPGRRLATTCIVAIFLVSAMVLLAKPQKSSDIPILPSGRYLSSHMPGDPQETNGLPTAIVIDPSGHYAALLNNGYGAADSGTKQSIGILNFATNQLIDFPDDRLAAGAHQTYF